MYARGGRGLGAKPGPLHLPMTESAFFEKWPAIGDGPVFGKNVMMVERRNARRPFLV
jgi:hypothetical protein